MVYGQGFNRAFVLAFFGVSAAAAVALIVLTINGDGPALAFTVFWLGALAWNAYWFLLRFAYRLTLTPETLTWEAGLRAGEVPVVAITRVRPLRLASGVVAIEHGGGRPIMAFAAKGLRRFLDELTRLRPDLDVRMGWHARLVERLPWPSAVRKDP